MALADIRALASKFFAAVSTIRGNLDNDFKVALFGAEGQESGAWGLSLVLGVWRRQKAGDSPAALAETGVAPLVAQIQKFEGAFPGSFSKFLATAEGAEDLGKIAAAGSYFASTVGNLGMLVRPGLLAWLNSDNFKKVAKALREVVGGPFDGLAERPPSPAITRPTRPNFDRQDFQTTAAPPPPPPKPLLALPENTQRDLDLARLIRSGWSPEEAARILEGPAALKRANEKEDGPRVVDGKEILKRSKPADGEPARKDDSGGIPGVIKSGLDLLREVLKQVNTGGSNGSGGKGGGGDSGSTNGGGNGGRGTMGGGSGSGDGEDDGGSGTMGGGSGSGDSEDDGDGGTMDGGGGGYETDDSSPDSGRGDGGPIVINDSSEVDD